MKKVILSAIICMHFGLSGCLFTLINDTEIDIFVTDQHSGHAVAVPRGKKAEIDPSLQGVFKFFKNEKMNFYIRTKDNKFFKKYQLVERYCVSDLRANDILVSHVLNGLQGEQKQRLYVNTFPDEAQREHHDHSAHGH